jgi:hypothetical protein
VSKVYGWQPASGDWASACCCDCQRLMRPAGTRAGDWPGTVEHVGQGRCYTCRRRHIQGRDRVAAMRQAVVAWLKSRGRTPGPDHFDWPAEDLELAA